MLDNNWELVAQGAAGELPITGLPAWAFSLHVMRVDLWGKELGIPFLSPVL